MATCTHTERVFDTEIHIEVVSNLPLQLQTRQTQQVELEDSVGLELSFFTEHARPVTIKQMTISWQTPIVDMQGLYLCGNPRQELSYLPYWRYHKESCANQGVPFLSLINTRQQNRFALGLLDQLTETHFEANLSESSRAYHFKILKPNSHAQLSGEQWTERLFISQSSQPWPEVLAAYRAWLDSSTAVQYMPVPAAAFAPVFCSWTAIHHEVSHDWVMRNARLAAELGFQTWLTDDGWFLKEGQFGNYRLVGDWQPEASKFPDFKAHVQEVKALGLNYLLWVAPFMIGDDNVRSIELKHLLTTGQEREAFKNLSPKHPETRHYISALLKRLVEDYQLDGLKIDFLDAIPARAEPLAAEAEGPFGEYFYATLKETIDALRLEKPELLIEFRNRYTNLASRSYANLYRSSDVPINPVLNRWQAVMLRLLAPDRAVHLDPALWHPEETDTNVAIHLLNCLVAVPTVSIELDRYPKSHLELLRYWIGFYNQHRQTFAQGKFLPVLRHGHIPAVCFEASDEAIVVVFEDVPLDLPRTPNLWLLNASHTPLSLALEILGKSRVTERDLFGRILPASRTTIPFELSVGGSLHVSPFR